GPDLLLITVNQPTNQSRKDNVCRLERQPETGKEMLAPCGRHNGSDDDTPKEGIGGFDWQSLAHRGHNNRPSPESCRRRASTAENCVVHTAEKSFPAYSQPVERNLFASKLHRSGPSQETPLSRNVWLSFGNLPHGQFLVRLHRLE